MQVPDHFTTLYLDGPQWYRAVGKALFSPLLFPRSEWHPFAERILVAAFDDFDIARDDPHRNILFQGLVRALSTTRMLTVARNGTDISQLLASVGCRHKKFDATSWARSSERREKMCPQGALAWFNAEHAFEGVQVEVREIAAAIWKEMEGIRADIADHHETHRPMWEKDQPRAADTGTAGAPA